MVKIKYIGDISPCSVKVYSATFKNWHRNEVREIGEHEAERLVTQNANFEVAKTVEIKQDKPKKPKQMSKFGEFGKKEEISEDIEESD